MTADVGVSNTLQTRIPASQLVGLRPVRDTLQAQELARKRWDKAKAMARLGVGDAAGEVPGLANGDKWGMLRHVAHQHALNAADPSARGSAASYRLTLAAFGMDDTKREEPVAGDSVDDKDKAELLSMFRQWKAANPGAALAIGGDTGAE